MEVFLIAVISIASIALILLVLIQNSKGGGLTADFGGAQQLGSVKQTNDIVENATWSLAGIIGVLSIVMTLMYTTPVITQDEPETPQTEQPQEQEQQVPAE